MSSQNSGRGSRYAALFLIGASACASFEDVDAVPAVQIQEGRREGSLNTKEEEYRSSHDSSTPSRKVPNRLLQLPREVFIENPTYAPKESIHVPLEKDDTPEGYTEDQIIATTTNYADEWGADEIYGKLARRLREFAITNGQHYEPQTVAGDLLRSTKTKLQLDINRELYVDVPFDGDVPGDSIVLTLVTHDGEDIIQGENFQDLDLNGRISEDESLGRAPEEATTRYRKILEEAASHIGE